MSWSMDAEGTPTEVAAEVHIAVCASAVYMSPKAKMRALSLAKSLMELVCNVSNTNHVPRIHFQCSGHLDEGRADVYNMSWSVVTDRLPPIELGFDTAPSAAMLHFDKPPQGVQP